LHKQMKLPRRAKNQVNEFHPRWTARHFHSRSALRPCGLCMPFSKLDYRYLCPFRRACILRNLGVPDYHITIGGRIKVRQYQPVAILSAQDVPDFSCGVSLSPCHDALCRHGCMEVGCGVALRIDLRPGSALESEPSLVVVGRRTVLSGLAGGNRGSLS